MKLVKPFFLNIVKNFSKNSKIYSGFILLLTFVFTVLLSFSCLDAKAASKPQLQFWQIDSIMADIEKNWTTVKLLDLEELAEYDLQDLQSVREERDHLKTNTVNLFEDKIVDTQELEISDLVHTIQEPCNALCSEKYKLDPSKIENCVKSCRQCRGKPCLEQ